MLDKLSTTLEEKGLSFRQSLQSTADDAIMDLDLRSGLYEERLQATVGQSTPPSTNMWRISPVPSTSAPAASTAS